MSIFVVEVETGAAGAAAQAAAASDEPRSLKLVVDLVRRVQAGEGQPGDNVRLIKSAVRASGTLTLSGATGAVGGTIAGTLKTVTAAGGDPATATALAAAINADATISQYVVATVVGAVVTLTALQAGLQGNRITLVASGTGVTASGATLANGAGVPVKYSHG